MSRHDPPSDDIRVRPGTGYPFGWSARVFGSGCILFGLGALAFNFALLLFLNVHYRAATILPMAVLFVGLVLVLAPARVARLDPATNGSPGSKVFGAFLLLALIAGLVLGGLLAFHPHTALNLFGLRPGAWMPRAMKHN